MKSQSILLIGVVCGCSYIGQRTHANADERKKLGVLERLEHSFTGKIGRDLEETITSVSSLLQRQRDAVGSEAGQKFAARLEQLLDTAKAQYEESSGHTGSEGEDEVTEPAEGPTATEGPIATEGPTATEAPEEKIGKALGSALSRLENGAGARFGGDVQGQVRDVISGLETGIRNRVEGAQGEGGSRLLEVAGGRLSIGADGEERFSRGGEGGRPSVGGDGGKKFSRGDGGERREGGSRVLVGEERLSGVAVREGEVAEGRPSVGGALGSEAGQKFTARLDQLNAFAVREGEVAGGRPSVGGDGQVPSLEFKVDGFGGLAAGIREGSVGPAGKPYVGANGEGLLGGDGGKPSFGGLQGNHTLDLGGLDRDGGLQGDFGGLSGLGRDHDGMWGGCQPPSTTSTTTATVSTLTASSTVTGTSTTTVGGRRLLPESVGAGLLNGGGHSDDHDHHTDGDHTDDGHDTDEIEWTMTTTDAPHTYGQVQYVADMLNKTDGWVLVQWPESKAGVKFPVRLLKKQRNAMAVEDVVLLYILRNGGVSEHVMTYFANRTADEFMRNPSELFAEKYNAFVYLLEMLWNLFVDFFGATTTTTATVTTSTTTGTTTTTATDPVP